MLQLPGETRWNSEYAMCCQFLDLMPYISKAINDVDNAFDLAPPEGLAPLIERYTTAFKPFYDLTLIVQRTACF